MATIPQDDRPSKALTRIVFRVPDRLAERIKVTAVRRKSSVQQLCTDALVAHLEAISKAPRGCANA